MESNGHGENSNSEDLALASQSDYEAETLQAPYERFGGRLDARRYLAAWKYQNKPEVEIATGKSI